MADIQANIGINLETANAMARLRALQQEVSNFHTAMAKGSATAQASAAQMQQNLLRNINKTGQFSAQMTTIKTTTESFTNALEKNKLSMGEYFRYAGASTRTFGRFFRSEFATINKVARERVKDLQTQYIKMGRDANGAMKAIAVRPLALDMDNLATRTMLAAQKQQLFNQLLRQGSTNLLNFGKNTQWAGRQLMVGFTIPLTIFGATAAREFMKLEEQAIKFRRVYGDMFTTSAQTEKALDNVRELADEFTKYGIAAEKTIELAAKVAQMGNMGDAMEAQVRQATRLSVLGGIEQQEALDTTISLTNAFGIATEDLAKNIDFLNAAENQTILSIEDFNEAIPKAGSVVRQLGGDVGDLAFFLTAMREGGVNASQGANALKSSLARLINPTEVAQKKLGEMGINVLGIVEANAGNLRGTIMALATELDKLDPLSRAQAIEQLFGKFQFARMSTLFQNIVKEGSQANKVLELTTKTTEELGILAERELGRVEDSVTYKFQKSLEQFQVALAPLGEAFLKAITPVIEFGTKILDKFNELGDGAKTFVVIAATALGAIGPVALMTFGLMANGVANLMKMFANMSMFYQRLTGQNRALGVSTDYMTREQLQASAVAASLQQSHARLIQVFTTETGALNRLAAAYNKTVAAQRAMVASGAGARAATTRSAGGTKKYAKGVVSVPGPKGAGDIIPAMLSPGEAVIPADMVSQYAPLIRGMVEGSIPRFASGTDGVYTRSTPEKLRLTDFSATDETRGSKAYKPTAAEKDRILKQAGLPSGSRLPSGSLVIPHAAKLYGQMPAQLMEERLVAEEKAIRSEAKKAGFSNRVIERMVTRQREHVIASQQAGGRTIKSWEMGAWRPGMDVSNQITEELRKQSGFRSEYEKSLRAANPGMSESRIKGIMAKHAAGVGLPAKDMQAHQKALSQFSKTNATGPYSQLAKQAGVASAGLAASNQVAAAQRANPKTSAAARVADIRPTDMKAAEQNLKRLAPILAAQKPSRQSGAQRVRESQVQQEKEKRSNKAVAQTRKKTQESREKSAKAEREVAKRGAKLVDQSTKQKQFKPTPTTLRLFSPKQIDSMLAAGKNPNRVAATMANKQITARTREILGKEGVAKALAEGKNPNKVAAGMAGQAARRAGATGAASAASAGSASRGMTPGAVGAIGMAGVIGASFAPGKIGEIAQQAILPMMLLPMLKPLVANPISAAVTAAVAAFGAMAIAIYAFNKMIKDAREAGREMADSISWSSDRIKQISEFTGMVSASELAERQRASLVAGPSMTSDPKFGQSFLESDAGIAFMEDVKRMQDAGMTADQISRSIGRNLTQAMVQGVLTKDQAHSIVMALGQQLSDYSIPLEINAQINSLVGPSGAKLESNPFDVAVNVQTDAIEQQVEAFEKVIASQDQIADQIFEDNKLLVGGSTALGAGIGGIVSALAAYFTGGAATPLAPVITAAGAAAGGTVGNTLLQGKITAAQVKASSEAVNLGFQALQLGQQQLDVIAQTEEQKISQLESELAIAETQEEQLRLQTLIGQVQQNAAAARQSVLDQNVGMMEVLQGQAAVLGESEFSQLAADAAQARYEGTGLESQAAITTENIQNFGETGFFEGLGNVLSDQFALLFGTKTQEDINEENAARREQEASDKEFRTTLEIGFGAGLLDFSTVDKLLEAAESNTDIPISFNLLVSKQGMANANIVTALLDKLELDVNEYPIVMDFMSNNEEDFQENLQALSYLAQVPQDYGFNIDFTGESASENIAAVGNAIEDLEGMPDVIEKQALIDAGSANATAATFLLYWDEITGGASQVTKDMIIRFSTLMAGDENLLGAYTAAMGMSPTQSDRFMANPNREEIASAYFLQQNYSPLIPEIPEVEEVEDTQTGGGTPSSVLDNLLKKLRDVQDATIKVAKGWDAARQSLDNLFNSGETMAIFGGLEQRMRGMNLGQGLIEMIVGMDPDEFEKRKGELFTFDAAGNITGITTALRNMQLAMNSIALGDFQNKQQETLTTYRDQVVAIDKLVRSGVSLSVAYKAVEDTAFASAVAQEKSNRKIREAAKDAERAAKATKDFAAAQAVVGGVEETSNQRQIADFLIKNRSRLTNAQVQAIIKDTNLQRLILDPSIDPRAVNQALQDAANQADLDLKINKLTIEGMTDIFNDGFSKAMEKFSAMEEQLKLDFNLTTKDDENIIQAAEREIETIRYQLDDLQADLTRIQDEEDKINNYYDDRIKALDEVANINERLAKQQQAQLNIADALSQGDIAAAARARQEYRQQQTSDALEQRKKRIEDSREESLNNIRLENGKSRLEIEQNIFDLQKEIFDIEEESLEPAQRRVDLANQELQDQMDSLTVLGKTREEWARIQNNIDIARTSSDSYTKAIQNALDVVADILEYWNELDGKQVTTYHQIVETRSSTPSPPPASPGPSTGNSGSGTPQLDPSSSERDNAYAQYKGYEASYRQAMDAAYSWNRKINLELIPKRKSYEAMPYGRARTMSIAGVDAEIEQARAQVNVNAQEANAIKAQMNALKAKWGFAMGGMVPYKNLGGLMGMALGGMFKSVNTDSIPAMLSAGEYVVKRSAVQNFGVDNLEKINSGTYSSGSVYNYNLAVNVKSDADPNKIARTVISQIKQIDAQRIRSNRL